MRPARYQTTLISSHKTKKSAERKLGSLLGESSTDEFEIRTDPDLPSRPFQVYRITQLP
jgi:hypothetical protein